MSADAATVGIAPSAAFFDLDRTLIRGSANYPLAVAAFRGGQVPWRDLVKDTLNAIAFHRQGSTDEGSAALRERILRAVAGVRQADVIHLADAIVPTIVRRVMPASAMLLSDARALGQDRIVVSASPIELVQPIADALGLEGAVATRSELDTRGATPGTSQASSVTAQARSSRSRSWRPSGATTSPAALPTATPSATCR